MLKCITFDGDVSTLNDLMEYLEKITQDLMEVNKLLCDKQAGQPIFLREGPRIVYGRIWRRLRKGASHRWKAHTFASKSKTF